MKRISPNPFTTRPEIEGTFGVVASTHWIATAVGMGILERGGNAFDAAVATAFTLQVVEPHLNGPGGDVPLILYDVRRGKPEVVCGQGPAPAGATLDHFRSEGLDLVPGAGGLAAAVPGARLTDISHAVESAVRREGNYGLVEEYVGHGIGTEMHQEPQVPNHGRPGRGPRLVPGVALAVEPMVNLGTRHTHLLEDGWTVVTQDGRPSAHFEHTVAVTERGPWVLTALDGGEAGLAQARGVATHPQPRSA